MKYLFDIGHPFEFHCFKNVMRNLIDGGHKIKITARDKDVNLKLLEDFGTPYFSTGKNLPSKLGKIYSLLRNDYRIFKVAKIFDPDVMVTFFSPFAAQAGKLLKKPVIGFHDTEKAGASILLSKPFTDLIVVPECYRKELPPQKTVRFKGVFELAYLHPDYFTPDPAVLDLLGVRAGEKYAVIRFVSHSALHDTGYGGMSRQDKVTAVQALRKHARVFISSEEELLPALKKYEIKLPPEKLHDALFYASLSYGESATVSSESAVLGTPAVFIDDTGRSYTDEIEEKFGLVFNFSPRPADQQKALQKGIEILNAALPQQEKKELNKSFLGGQGGRFFKKAPLVAEGKNNILSWQRRRAVLLSYYIDVTAFMTEVITSFPRSSRGDISP
ncbi:MAG: DUF354 domain-containing protein [Candidatus Aminicenantes bacterium]|nr:DUF354 domain-containing protein [Candidatus Aminicenantes bacterium]